MSDEVLELTWKTLPDHILEKIFSYLQLRDRFSASQVCFNWYQTFFSPHIWKLLEFNARSFTRKRFNMYEGYQYEISHYRLQQCLHRVGSLFSEIIVHPIDDFYNLHEILHVLNSFLIYFDDYPMPRLYRFSLWFACTAHSSRSRQQDLIFGTGGGLLAKICNVLAALRNLRDITLNQLLLASVDAGRILSAIVDNCSLSLQNLETRNLSLSPAPCFQLLQLHSLRSLELSPFSLNDSLVSELPSCLPHLECLKLTQDAFTPALPAALRDDVLGNADVNSVRWSISNSAWRTFRKCLTPERYLEVHLRAVDGALYPPLLHAGAPVSHVLLDSEKTGFDLDYLQQLSAHYSDTLECLVALSLPRRPGPRSFTLRPDRGLVQLVRLCPRLRLLAWRDRLSTCSLLLLAQESAGRLKLYLRRNTLTKRADWPVSCGVSEDQRRVARNYDLTRTAVSVSLQNPDWNWLSDKEYRDLTPKSLHL